MAQSVLQIVAKRYEKGAMILTSNLVIARSSPQSD
jgi:hypothetical protein